MKTLIGCLLLASLALTFTAKAGYEAYKVEQAQQGWAKSSTCAARATPTSTATRH